LFFGDSAQAMHGSWKKNRHRRALPPGLSAGGFEVC